MLGKCQEAQVDRKAISRKTVVCICTIFLRSWYLYCHGIYLIFIQKNFNPYLTNRFSHHYHLGESTVNFRGVRREFDYLIHFSIKFL